MTNKWTVESATTQPSDNWLFERFSLKFSNLQARTQLLNSLLFVVKASLCIIIIFYGLYKLKEVKRETQQTTQYVNSPKVNDIYFLDYRLLNPESRPTQRFRIAKLVDITGEILTFKYSNLFYQNQNAIEQSIQYGQLRYSKFFETKRYDFSHSNIISMTEKGVIYRVERPNRGQLYGNYVSPQRIHNKGLKSLPGYRENLQGEEWLKGVGQEDQIENAFAAFERSAKKGFAPAQVNLAQLYLGNDVIEKDLSMALHWLFEASLQSHKPAILKFVIVCQQVAECNEAEFYKSLMDAGVSIKVRALSEKISLTP